MHNVDAHFVLIDGKWQRDFAPMPDKCAHCAQLEKGVIPSSATRRLCGSSI